MKNFIYTPSYKEIRRFLFYVFALSPDFSIFLSPMFLRANPSFKINSTTTLGEMPIRNLDSDLR